MIKIKNPAIARTVRNNEKHHSKHYFTIRVNHGVLLRVCK